MPATVRHVTRINSQTTLCAARAASHAQLSSNACVNRAPARAHGTAATTTPHRRHSTRGAGASRNTIIVPESKDRHRRTPPPASYPRHRRPHREHRDLAAPVGRTEITSTSSSVPSSPSNQNPSTVVRSTRRTFRHTLDARTPFPVQCRATGPGGPFRTYSGRPPRSPAARSPSPHRHRGDHIPLLVVAVADHHPVPVRVDDVGELLDVRGHLGPQRRRQHLPGTVPDQLIQQRPRRIGRRLLRSFLSNYREHGRTFPTGVGDEK